MPAFNPFDEVPGYKEAIEREQALRDSAALDLTEVVAGIEVMPMNVRHLLLLEGTESPFICGGTATAADIGRFFWIVSPPGTRFRKLMRRVRTLNLESALTDIYQYVDDACCDMIGGSEGGKAPFCGMAASIIHTIASNYGWRRHEIMEEPLKMVWQYFRCIRKEAQPDKPILNRSDELMLKSVRNN